MQKIDYTKNIDRSCIDWDKYNSKFETCDKIFNSETDVSAEMMQQLLNDPTTFAYLNLRLDGKPLKFYPYQDLIINDAHRFKFFRASNQIGKSLLLDAKAAMNLIIDHGKGHNEAIVSKSLPQSTYQMRRVKSLLHSLAHFDWKSEKGETDSLTVLSYNIKDDKGKIKYTNYLVCAPCTEGLLGYDLHDLNLDEFEFWDVNLEYFYNQIAEPRTYHTKGNITLFSNPNGADSYGAELENLYLPDGTRKFHVYVFNFLDKPGNTEYDLEIAKLGKTRSQIESTLLAVRTISDKYFFTSDEIESSYDKKLEREKEWIADDKETYWFLDVGAKKDQSVLTGCYTEKNDDGFLHIYVFCVHVYPAGYPLSRVVGSHDLQQTTDGWHYEKSVREYLEDYSLVNGILPVFGCDVTGNQGMIPLFNSVNIYPEDIVFSGAKKWAMFQRLKYYLEKKLLHIIKNDKYDYQMRRIIVTKLGGYRYNRVGHENENDFDDVPDSLAGLIYLCDNPDNITPGFTSLSNKQTQNNEDEEIEISEEDSLIL